MIETNIEFVSTMFHLSNAAQSINIKAPGPLHSNSSYMKLGLEDYACLACRHQTIQSHSTVFTYVNNLTLIKITTIRSMCSELWFPNLYQTPNNLQQECNLSRDMQYHVGSLTYCHRYGRYPIREGRSHMPHLRINFW